MRRKRGTGGVDSQGYMIHGSNGSYKYEHVIVAEKALGRPLPSGAVVHHWNMDKLDNRPKNLLICPSNSYHQMIHRRMRAHEACGHADWRKCAFCKEYDDPERMHIVKSVNRAYHRPCANKARMGYLLKAKGQRK